MRVSAVPTLLMVLTFLACGGTNEPGDATGAAAPIACADLGSLSVPDTTITTAEVVPAGAFEPPRADPFGAPPDFSALPAFCRVAGSIAPSDDSDIRFELWLPAESWNGRFMQTGNGGAAGSIVYGSLVMPLARGYAVANTDTGHEGGGGEFSWAAGHPEKLVDYQYRAVRQLTLAGKAITEAHYGQAPRRSYWLGCSTGGRQGLKEAQKYPEDYDAVIAGAPANNWSPLLSLSVLVERNLGAQGLSPQKLRVLREAAIAACDAVDGVSDRVIMRPEACAFDPASTRCKNGRDQECLTASEVEAAKRIYGGLVDAAGEVLMPGTGPASELEWAAYASEGFRIGTSYYRNVVTGEGDWDPATFDVETDLARAEAVDGGAAKAMDPDLSAFVARGGKLLIYHGTTDGLIPYGNSVRYYESVVEKLGAGAVSDSVKLYLVPGMNHCSGGEGTFGVEWLAAMEQWAEEGRLPSPLVASHPTEQGVAFTRPLCAYPESARYRGEGDESDAASFECVAR